MELTLLTDTQAREALNLVLGGDLEPYNVASDLVRHEVSARRRCPRHFLIGRVCRLAAPAIALDAEMVGDVCEDLERQGDVVLAEGGVVYPAPLRIVALGGDLFRFVCAVPSARLFATVKGEWTRRGARRDCRPLGPIEQVAENLGGILSRRRRGQGSNGFPPPMATGFDRWMRGSRGPQSSLEASSTRSLSSGVALCSIRTNPGGEHSDMRDFGGLATGGSAGSTHGAPVSLLALRRS